MALAKPTNVTAVVRGDNAVEIRWTDNSSVETGYQVQRRVHTIGTWGYVATPLPANSTWWVDRTATAGVAYDYRIRCYKPGGSHSDWSAIATVNVPVVPTPKPPTDILLSNSVVAENVPPGTLVGTLTAVDADSASFTFTISSTDGPFAISGNQLLTDGNLDYHIKSSYTVTILCTDDTGLFYGKTFTILVQDIIENPVVGTGIVLRDCADWECPVFNNIAKQFRPPGEPAAPWTDKPSIRYTSEGYPMDDFGCVMAQYDVIPGAYTVTYQGSGTMKFSNNYTVPRIDADHCAGTVTFSGSNNFWYGVTGVDAANPPRNLVIQRAGTTGTFDARFLAAMSVYSPIRCVGWLRQATLAGKNPLSATTTWATRPLRTNWTWTTSAGVPWEIIVELANATGKALVIGIPIRYSRADVQSLAAFLAAGLDPDIHVYFELANECWNSIYPPYQILLGQATANPLITTTNVAYKINQQMFFLMRQYMVALRAALGVRAHCMLNVQAGNTDPANKALQWLVATYPGESPRSWIDLLAYAPYFHASDLSTVDTAFTTIMTDLSTTNVTRNQNWKTFGASWGIPIACYECGSEIEGSGVAQQIVDDPRMGTAFATAKQNITDAGAVFRCWTNGDRGPRSGNNTYALSPNYATTSTPKRNAVLP